MTPPGGRALHLGRGVTPGYSLVYVFTHVYSFGGEVTHGFDTGSLITSGHNTDGAMSSGSNIVWKW